MYASIKTPFGPVSFWAERSSETAAVVASRWEYLVGGVHRMGPVVAFFEGGGHLRRVDAQVHVCGVELALQWPSPRFVRAVLRARRMAARKSAA